MPCLIKPKTFYNFMCHTKKKNTPSYHCKTVLTIR